VVTEVRGTKANHRVHRAKKRDNRGLCWK
jgi:hypothetical protein